MVSNGKGATRQLVVGVQEEKSARLAQHRGVWRGDVLEWDGGRLRAAAVGSNWQQLISQLPCHRNMCQNPGLRGLPELEIADARIWWGDTSNGSVPSSRWLKRIHSMLFYGTLVRQWGQGHPTHHDRF